MPLAELPSAALRQRLRGSGLNLVCGPFTYRIRSPLPKIEEGLALLYAHHPVADEDAWVDFEIEVQRSWRPGHGWMAQFRSEGESPFEPMVADHAFPLLEWGMNWCMATTVQHYLLLHAAVLERGGRALILPAPPGSGKSTLCASLMFSGWRLLTDEMALIPLDGPAVSVLPLGRAVSLKNASIPIIQRFAPQAVFNEASSDTVKGVVSHLRPLPAHVERLNEAAVPAWLVFPKFEADAPLAITPLARPRTMVDVIDQSFNYGQLGRLGFETLAALMGQVATAHLRFGSLAAGLQGIDDWTGASDA